jgi:hypothetical protein
MLCSARALGALTISLSMLLGARAGAQSAGRVGETRSLSVEQARTRGVASAAPEPRPVTAGRVVVEGVGAATGAVAALTLGLGFFAMMQPSCDSDYEQDFCGIDAAIGGGVVALGSALLLMPAGTYIAGNAMGGQGGYGWTLLGSTIGIAAGVLGSTPLFKMEEHDTGALLGAFVLTGSILAGNVLGYELSSASAARRAPAKAAQPGLALYPHAGIASGRFVLGVTGGF